MTNAAALVTGGRSGIGRAVCNRLAREGWVVFAADIAPGDDLSHESELVRPIILDVTRDLDATEAAEVVRESGLPLCALVNCAGIVEAGPLMEADPDRIARTIEVNTLGMVRVTRALFPMIHDAGGTVVNITSFSGLIALPFMGAYAMSKHAAEAFTDSLRREVAPLGVRVVAIEPGKVDTPFKEKVQSVVQETAPQISDLFRDRGLRFAAFDRDRFHTDSVPPERVADVVWRAITARRPRTRYLVVRHPLKARVLLALSDRALDRKMQGI